jgi:quinol monooxygenase YgiN
MSNHQIRVIATLIGKPGFSEKLKSILISLVEPTRQEEGCIQYELLQNQEVPEEFTFYEIWETQEHLNSHLASKHLQKTFSEFKSLLEAEPTIRTYSLVA